jgi:hypothetical protein
VVAVTLAIGGVIAVAGAQAPQPAPTNTSMDQFNALIEELEKAAAVPVKR